MLDLLVAWLLFPASVLAACVGLGAGLRRCSGSVVTGALVVPLGMAALICVTQVLTAWTPLAVLDVPVTVVAALFGVAVVVAAVRRGLSKEVRVALVLGAAVFVVYAAPVVGSGKATVSGYTVLGDTVVQLIGADLLTDRGRDTDSLPPSTYQRAAKAYYDDTQYPAGALTALGAVTGMSAERIIWLYQPFLALLAVCLALSLFGVARQIGLSPWVAAAVAFIAAQPALFYGYFLQGSIKEIATAGLIALLAWAAAAFVARGAAWRPREISPFAVVAGALIGVLGLAAGIWVLPAAVLIVVIRRRSIVQRPRAVAVAVAIAAALMALASVQSLQGISQYVEVAGTVNTTASEKGNLLRELDPRQVLGVWITGEYRLSPPGSLAGISTAIGWLVAVAAGLGLVLLARRRSVAGLGYALISIVGALVVIRTGSPWADGKALAVGAPAVMFIAGCGLALISRGRLLTAVGVTAGAVIGAGVLWSNALAYHDASLAPRERLDELQELGDRARSPVFAPEFEEYAKYLLRDAAPDVPLDAWSIPVLDRDAAGDIIRRDAIVAARLDHSLVASYPALVLRRGSIGGPPATGFRLAHRGRWYDLWERDGDAPEILGTAVPESPNGETIPCATIRALAAKAPAGGALVALPSSPRLIGRVTSSSFNWPLIAGPRGPMRLGGPGEAEGVIDVADPGRYRVWLGGRFGREVRLDIDGRRVGVVANELGESGSEVALGSVTLPAGRHRFTITLAGPDLKPGNGMANRAAGPVVLQRLRPGSERLLRVDRDDWRSLCGKPVRWIEAQGPSTS